MALQPVLINGRVRLQQMTATDTVREEWLKDEENQRRIQVMKRRMYSAGEQYDAENANACAANDIDPVTGRLPEHLRKHAYSTQIQECVDFLADQMSTGFSIQAADPAVQDVIDALLRLSPDFSGPNDDDDVDPTNVLRDGLVAGDSVVRLVYDAAEDAVWLQVYESEMARFDYSEDDRNLLERVVMEYLHWVQVPDGEQQQVWRDEYSMKFGSCWLDRYVDGDEQPSYSENLRLPFIPWALLRAQKKTLSATRGESVITEQAMTSADRYNAVEQTSWLIARYNSHGNLVVVGDAASLKLDEEGSVSKDVADVLTFPGGTAVTAITLPTDPQMIQHQHDVLLDSLYGSFGLTRVDQTTIQGLGGISGYALEILNRKTDGTFDRIRSRWSRDLKAILNMALDMLAVRRAQGAGAPESEFEVAIEEIDPLAPDETLLTDVMTAFPDRAIEIRLGGAYIVDDKQILDDFVANLISRAEALRKRGYDDEDIESIQDEIDEEKPPEPEVGLSSTTTTQAGRTLASTSPVESTA